MQQRYYDPQIGRFLSVDPANSEFNRYDYAANNPYRFIDPDGRQTAKTHEGETAEQRAAALAERKRTESEGRIGGAGNPSQAAVATSIAGQTAGATAAVFDSLAAGAKAAGKAAPGLPASEPLLTIAKDAGKAAKGFGVISAGVDAIDMLAPNKTSGERLHGAAGFSVFVVATYAAAPEIGVAYSVLDFAAQRAVYFDEHGRTTTGWPAVGRYTQDAQQALGMFYYGLH